MIRLLHHHLRRGGVTRVMVKTAELLRDAGEEVCILTGEPPPEPLPEGIGFQVIPGMGYPDEAHQTDADDLFATLSALYDDGDLWHIHNHSLGKNPAVTDVWVRLVEAGQRVVFQPHDFAEDGRPGNLTRLRNRFPGFPDRLYPVGDHLRYAVLQERDRGVLTRAGIPSGHIHLLPNPVATETFAAPCDPPRRILYLTRAIRRKNIGEFLYWAQQLGRDLEFATSLLPENPAEKVIFDQWQAFAEEQNIPVTWGIGASGTSFREVVEWSDACITTSVGEGFGMSYLEPYAMGRNVAGRDLPGITAGFKHDGVDLAHLYPALPVPADAVDADFWRRAEHAIHSWRTHMGEGRPVDMKNLQQQWIHDGRIDFGRLDEAAQQHVLRTGVAADTELVFGDARTQIHNRDAIRNVYAPDSYLNRLRALYRDVGAPGRLAYANGFRVRDSFLDITGILLLRT